MKYLKFMTEAAASEAANTISNNLGCIINNQEYVMTQWDIPKKIYNEEAWYINKPENFAGYDSAFLMDGVVDYIETDTINFPSY